MLANTRKNQGNISMVVLIFGVTFASMAAGLALFGAVENNNARRNVAQVQALAIAEAGVNYYRWHLAHDPDDYQDGTGQPGPYIHEYNDPEAGISGTFTLEITPPAEGSEIVTITSTGQSDELPTVKRTITTRFGPIPLTQFSFLHNSNVWFGQGLTVYGEVFSNGGIRFDGENQSAVRSARETYNCGYETGCNPTQVKDGVWGIGGPQELWEFPAPSVDFDGIVTDFNAMKSASQSNGIYLAPSSNWGYHVVFDSDGTVDIYEVTSASNKRGWSVDEGCMNLYQTINDEQLIGTYSLADNKIIYSEDTVWVEGVVNGQISVVAARLPTSTYTTNIYINNPLTYIAKDGTNQLGVIAQNDIIFAYDIPQTFEINGALLAQDGKVLRHMYNSSCTNGSKSKSIRQLLIIYGTIISNQKSYWNFAGYGGLRSGFINREISFDQAAAEVPPPYFPSTDTYKYLSWEEK